MEEVTTYKNPNSKVIIKVINDKCI
ncbi:MAG: hypothetical protein ACD_25C00101G0001, partial [uncultured bacterium]